MTETYLVATDMSARSDRAVRRAFRLARQNGAEVIVAHIVDDAPPPDVAAQHLEASQEALDRFVVEDGPVALRGPLLPSESGPADPLESAEDPLGTTEGVYDFCGLPWTPAVAAEVARIARGSKKIARAWKDELEPSVVETIERVLDDSPMSPWWDGRY